MDDLIHLELNIDPGQAGSYFTIPFTMPEDAESLTINYRYGRYDMDWQDLEHGFINGAPEINIIDLGLVTPAGEQAGATGSDKREITISETFATPGCIPCVLTPGEWRIIVGAYKVAPQGVRVDYDITIKGKSARWLKGDLHTHTIASDGVLTASELGWRALRHGLDYIAVTDHNQVTPRQAFPSIPGLTLIPGIEWTHYKGHASFLGVDQPYDGPYTANALSEVQALFASARQRQALITIDHPFEPGVEFKFDLQALPYDCLEIWNGPMRESNLKAVGWWNSLLCAGRRIPACGGSDFHRDTPFIFPGGPTTWVWSQSAGPSDILAALRQGHAYITYAPDGPSLEMTSGDEYSLGDSVPWKNGALVHVAVDRLVKGDLVHLAGRDFSTILLESPGSGKFESDFQVEAPGFVRLEVLRSFLPGVPMLPALISNPIYFD